MNIITVVVLVICTMLLTIFCIICFCVFTNNDKLLNMLMNNPDDIGFRNMNKINDKYGKSK
jgi:hypothetical protein